MNKIRIGAIEAVCIICIITLSNILLAGPQIILRSTGSSALLNTFFISLLAFIVFYIIYLLFKNFKNSDILDISSFLAGNWLKVLLGISIILFLLLYASTNYRDMAENLKIIYFQNINITYILLLIIIPVAIVNCFGFNTVIKCNLIILPLILLTILIIFILGMPKFVLQNIFPILGNGIKSTFLTGSQNISVFGGLIYLFLIMPLLKRKDDFKKVSFTSLAVSSIALTLSTACLLFILPVSIITKESIPFYIAIKQISLGNFIERVDILFLFIWLLTIFSNLSILISFILLIFKKITNIEDTKPLILTFCSILLGIALIYKNENQLTLAKVTIYKNIFLILVLGVNISILVLANIKKKIKDKNKTIAEVN